jgi:glycosyltransferase involved in cell wall biosynthesis
MRILYVLTSLGIGGAEKQVLALGRIMAERGHIVALLVLRPPLAEQWPTRLDVLHLNLRKSPLSILRGISRGRRFLRQFRPDVVHGHGFHGNIAARGFHALGGSPAPISTLHNIYEGGWLRMSFYRLTDPFSRLTTAVSAAARERFVRLKAVPSQKCIVIANGIDTAEFTPDPGRRASTRAAMSAGDHFIWLSAGRVVPAKDYPNLLRAFAQLHPKRRSMQLWIAGEGTESEVTRIRALGSELGLGGSVRFLGLRRDLPALLDAADGFVLGSAWEGMPIVIGEAMATEKPIVATNVGGTRELLGETGLLVPPHDSSALSGAMLRVLHMTCDDRYALGRSARLRIEQHFSIDAKADEWEALYESTLSHAH